MNRTCPRCSSGCPHGGTQTATFNGVTHRCWTCAQRSAQGLPPVPADHGECRKEEEIA